MPVIFTICLKLVPAAPGEAVQLCWCTSDSRDPAARLPQNLAIWDEVSKLSGWFCIVISGKMDCCGSNCSNLLVKMHVDVSKLVSHTVFHIGKVIFFISDIFLKFSPQL